jgi:glycosyltransferase involved in cell wall biosynthesis
MMRISFVVPTRSSVRTLESCLQSLATQTHPDVEIVVIDNGSTDGTPELARRYADVVEDWGPERSAQRNRGLRRSSGEVVMFVDSDMVLEPGVAAELAAVLGSQPGLGALVVPERSFGEGYLARCRALEKSLYVGDPAVEAPRAFRRSVIDAVGGWDERLTAAEDWELADRIRAAGVPTGRVRSWIWHDEGRIQLRATFAKKRYYGRWIADYLRRGGGTGTRKLARTALLAHPVRLLREPGHAAGMALLKLVEAAGLLAGMVPAWRAERRA